MIVKIPKDIDATEAKIFAGLSLKKAGFAAIALGIAVAGVFGLHLPPAIASIPAGVLLFLGFYTKQGMSAWTISLRVIQAFLNKQEYTAERVATSHIKTEKEMQKDAKAWNKELRRQKKRHPNAQMIPSIRCNKSQKTRK